MADGHKEAPGQGDEASRGAERVIVRTTAGLALLLMCSFPLSLVPTLWTWDVRWLLSGLVLGLVGFGLGLLIRDGAKVQQGSVQGDVGGRA